MPPRRCPVAESLLYVSSRRCDAFRTPISLDRDASPAPGSLISTALGGLATFNSRHSVLRSLVSSSQPTGNRTAAFSYTLSRIAGHQTKAVVDDRSPRDEPPAS
jgi:hypothetical protein